jgi:CheY-like chemotaxis protein
VQQVDRCTEITRNLLDFARKRDPVIQAVEVNRIIEDMTMLVEKEARHNNITIVWQYDQELPVIYSDAPQWRQVILNFLTNAPMPSAKTGSSPSPCRSAGNRSRLPMTKPRILLVDDEERFRTNLEKMLGAQGLAVRAQGSGAAALEELKRHPYDVIVLDVRMPGMDGLATLAEIKKINPGVEVIIFSGHASMDAAMEIIKLGGYDYLMKPCPLEELLLKIEAAYEKKVEREERMKKPPAAEADS